MATLFSKERLIVKQLLTIIILVFFLVTHAKRVNAQSNSAKNEPEKPAPTTIQSDVVAREMLNDWKKAIADYKEEGSGLELRSGAYQQLRERGPNILPALAQAYQEETDSFVLYHYGFLFKQVAGFEIYTYTEEPFTVAGQEFMDSEPQERPFLSAKREELFADLESSAKVARRLHLDWWGRRNSFLQRASMKEKVLAVTGQNENASEKLSARKARMFNKTVQIYGIYNIPIYFELVAEDNNAAAFCDFLRITGHPEYRNLPMTNDFGENAKIADAAYSTKRQKLFLMTNWWTDNKSKFTELTELHAEIEKRVGQIEIPE